MSVYRFRLVRQMVYGMYGMLGHVVLWVRRSLAVHFAPEMDYHSFVPMPEVLYVAGTCVVL